MGCHLLLSAIILSFWGATALSQTASPTATATTSTTISMSASGASNVVNQSGVISIYYSNIYDVDTDLGLAGGYFAWDPASKNCNKNLNATCVVPSSLLNIQVSDNVATSGSSKMYFLYNSTSPSTMPTGLATANTNVIPGQAYTANQQISVTVPFSTICTVLSSAGAGIDNNCNPTTVAEPLEPVQIPLWLFADANGNAQIDSGEHLQEFYLYIDSSIPIGSSSTNLVGITQFQLFPGDEQAHIRSLSPESTWPTGDNGSVGAQFLTFLYVQGPDITTSFDATTFGKLVLPGYGGTPAYSIANIAVNSDGSLQSEYINGLQNQVSYYFRAAITDMAGNIGFVTGGNANSVQPDDTPTGTSPGLPAHAVKPDQIAGLLLNSGTCFVATAAYGSPMASQVQTFREFRDKILEKTPTGQKFVKWYYNHGQYWADRIRDHDGLRAIIRFGLYPLLGYSWIALRIGAYNASLLLSTLILLPLLFFNFIRSRETHNEENS